MKRTYISYATRMGFTTGYNQPVTKLNEQKDRLDFFPVAFCPECKQAFDRKKTCNGRPNKTNILFKPEYLHSDYPTYKLDRELCGVNKCHNKKERN